MLPSLRLIVATFLFGFVVVFAGLRVAAITRIAHDSLPGLATPAVAASVVLAHVQPDPVMPPIASAPATPSHIEFIVPVLFDLNSVISATAAMPETAPLAPGVTPVPAELAPLTILPETGLQPAPEATRTPTKRAELTILPETAWQTVSEPPPAPPPLAKRTLLPDIELQSGPQALQVPAELAKLTVLPEIVMPSAPATRPAAHPDLTLASRPQPTTGAGAAVPVAAEPRTEAPAAAEGALTVEPAVAASAPSPSMDSLLADEWRVSVMIRLPVAKPPPRAKTQTVRAKRPRPARQVVARDPFARPARHTVARDPFDFFGKRQF
jgi:hypothetical protein